MPNNKTEDFKKYIAIQVVTEINRQKLLGKKTSKGEKMSMAAIGRTLDPPVKRCAVHQVVNGNAESRRIKIAIESELGKSYWIIKDRKSKDNKNKVAA